MAQESGSRSASVFGNPISVSVRRQAKRNMAAFQRRFGDDGKRRLGLVIEPAPMPGPLWGLKMARVLPMREGLSDRLEPPPGEKPIIIGTIRMGYGHFRISMAIASAAHAMGFTPYWFDLHSFAGTTAQTVVSHLNGLYSLGSRLSQSSRLFNALFWEPLNSEGFRRLSYNAKDQAVSELFAPACSLLPKDIPFVATHAWPAQGAVHAGLKRVVNVIPDNWPMALHLAEGSLHAVQTPFAYGGYRSLAGMAGSRELKAMPPGSLFYAGHYVDQELLDGLEADCAARLARRKAGAPLRLLASVGGAGAQKDYLVRLIDLLAPELASGSITLWINAGDHEGVRDFLAAAMKDRGLELDARAGGADAQPFDPENAGHGVFFSRDIFQAVYRTNELMRSCDLLLTKPSELAYYPVPKLLIRRIGGHEAYGAAHSAELGDGTPEQRTPQDAARALRLMLADGEYLGMMNKGIVALKAAGTYDGARRVIEQAVRMSGRAAQGGFL